jgi:hypothetical protein
LSGHPYVRRHDPFGWLYNPVTWKDAQGDLHRIEEMEPQHARNSLRMLERNAFRLARAYWSWIWADPIMAPRGDMATDDCERFEREALKDPVRWLRQFPLVEALEKRGAERERRGFMAPSLRRQREGTTQ